MAARAIAANQLDGRTALARELRDGANAMAEQFGGWALVPYSQERIIRHLGVLDVIASAEGDWILKRISDAGGVVDEADAALCGTLNSYGKHLATLLRGLTQLGADAAKDKRDDAPDLASYLAQNSHRGAMGAAESDASRQSSAHVTEYAIEATASPLSPVNGHVAEGGE